LSGPSHTFSGFDRCCRIAILSFSLSLTGPAGSSPVFLSQ
jgi:hypothetical protein